ncbi:MAG: S8 family serine peptidase, partial [Planctomycetota bacterium]|nr:S8 family serine peptidase [Planctomycetota bacterium]
MRSRDPRVNLAIASVFLLVLVMGAWRLARKGTSPEPGAPAGVWVTLTSAGMEAHWGRRSPAERYVLDLSLDGKSIFYDTRLAFGEELDVTSYRIPESLLSYLDAGQEIQIRLWRIEDGKGPAADEPVRVKVPARFAGKGPRSPEERERVVNFFRGTSTSMKLSRLPARGDRSEPRDSAGPAWLDDEIVVTFKRGTIPAREEVDRIGFPIERVRLFSGDEAFRLQLSPTGDVVAALKRLKELGAVIRAQPNLVFHACDLNVRERELPLRQYAPQRVKASFVWQRDFGGDGVIVGVVDTGLNGAPGSGTTTHKEFDGTPDYSYPNWSAVGTSYPQGIWVDYGTVIRPAGSDLLFACITDPNGLAGGYKGSEPAWPTTIGAKVNDVYPAWPGAGQAVALNTKIKPTGSSFVFLCIQAGTTGSSQPSWPGSIGGQVNDGTARWEAVCYPVQWEAIVEYYGFRPRILPKVMYGPNFIGSAWSVPPNANIYPNDAYGHGTHTAGIIGAEDDGDKLDWFKNGGIAGIAPRCTILPVKSVDNNGYATSITICQGIDYAAHYGARVIYVGAASSVYANLSDVALIDMMETASINYALSRGAVVVAPMGNDRSSLPTYPACIQGVIAVGASMGNEKPGEPSALASFSNNGPWMSVVAPGVSIYSSDGYSGNPGDYVMWTGTSQAAAVVAGVCALIAERYPAMTPAEIKRRLETTAVDLGPAGYDPFYGWGCVDAAAAVATSSSDISDLLAYTPGRVVHFEYIEEVVGGDWSASKLIIRFNEDMNTEDVVNLAYYDLYMDSTSAANYTAYNLATWASGSVTASYSNRVLTISNLSSATYWFPPSKPRQPVAIRVSRNVRTAAGDYPMNTSEGQGGSESYFTLWQTSTSETDQYLPGTSTAPFKPRIPTCYGHAYGYTYDNGTRGGIKIKFHEPIERSDVTYHRNYKCYANPLSRPNQTDVLVSESELATGATAVNITGSGVREDWRTRGTWKGTYGTQGYYIKGSGSTPYSSLPAGVTVSIGGANEYTWASTTDDLRALQKPDPATDRIAACWYNNPSFAVGINVTGGTRQVALYSYDWDGGRRMRVDFVDPWSGVTVYSHNIDTDYRGGVYLIFNLSGGILLRFVNTGSYNAVLSGIFFDPDSTGDTPFGTPSPTSEDWTTKGTWKGTYGSQGWYIRGTDANTN